MGTCERPARCQPSPLRKKDLSMFILLLYTRTAVVVAVDALRSHVIKVATPGFFFGVFFLLIIRKKCSIKTFFFGRSYTISGIYIL